MRTPAAPVSATVSRAFLAAAGLALALVLGGCGEERKAFDATTPAVRPAEAEVLDAEIAQLAAGKDIRDDDGAAAHDEAVSKLTARGSAVEPKLIDTLRSHADWNVRLGCIEVLQSVGSKVCVEHVIAALLDEQPLVAFHANHTLEALTSHHVIPAPGAAVPEGTPTAATVPPVPTRAADDLAMDAELRAWTQWYALHGRALHDGWAAWWKDNAAKTRVD